MPELNNFRRLTVGPVGEPGVALALLPVPGQPGFSDEPRGQIHALLAKGAIGGYFFAVDDCRASNAELAGRGVEFTQPSTEQPYAIDTPGFATPGATSSA